MRWAAQPGRLLLTGYDSRGRMGLLDEAVQLAELTGLTPDVAAVRQLPQPHGRSAGR